jgi:hypothetical protein
MGDRIRLPFFILAAVAVVLVVGAEAGSSLIPGGFDPGVMRLQTDEQLRKNSDLSDDERADVTSDMVRQAAAADKPPGLAIADLALLDGLLLFSLLLMSLSMIIAKAVHAKLQGIATVIVAILALLAAIVLFFKAFIELMIMVGLFLAVPFGTLAYLAVWGFFNTGGASAVLGATMFLKLAFLVLLVFAHQRFLQEKGLMLMVASTLLCTFLIGLLHGFVPIILVSITDAVAAIIVCIVVAIWAIALLIGGIISVVRAVI